MDTTLAPAASAAPTGASALPAPFTRVLAMPARTRLMLGLATAAVAAVALELLRRGYKIRH